MHGNNLKKKLRVLDISFSIDVPKFLVCAQVLGIALNTSKSLLQHEFSGQKLRIGEGEEKFACLPGKEYRCLSVCVMWLQCIKHIL